MIKKWNICTRKEYGKEGQEKKAYWPNVGSLTFFPAYQDRKEGYKLELNMFPDVQFYVFEQVDREKPKSVKEEPEGEISPDDIPY